MAERTIDLIAINNTIIEDKIVRKAMADGKKIIYYAPDPDTPRIGYYVRLPPIIQATYRCSNCPRIVVATMFLNDILRGRIAKVKRCTDCKARMGLRALGPERERPVVIREKQKTGLDQFVEGD